LAGKVPWDDRDTNDVTKKKDAEQSAEQLAGVKLVRLAKEQGLSLTGPDELLKLVTTIVINVPINRATRHWDTEGPPTG
jgi:hypothetical protein